MRGEDQGRLIYIRGPGKNVEAFSLDRHAFDNIAELLKVAGKKCGCCALFAGNRFNVDELTGQSYWVHGNRITGGIAPKQKRHPERVALPGKFLLFTWLPERSPVRPRQPSFQCAFCRSCAIQTLLKSTRSTLQGSEPALGSSQPASRREALPVNQTAW